MIFEKHKKYLIMMIGLPASGKSTMACQMNIRLFDYQALICGTDQIIEDIAEQRRISYNQAFEQVDFNLIERQMFDSIKKYLNQGKTIIWDQTNLAAKSRKTKLDKLDIPDDYIRVAVYMDVDDDTLDRQAGYRKHKIIPLHIVDRMKRTANLIPNSIESFDHVISFRQVIDQMNQVNFNYN